MAEPVRSGSQCRRCRAPIALAAEFCPRCGASDPAGFKMAQVGSLIYGGLIAAAVTGLYAWIMSSEWERWESKLRNLPDHHPLANAAWESAIAIGAVILLTTWIAAGYLLTRFVRDRARARV